MKAAVKQKCANGNFFVIYKVLNRKLSNWTTWGKLSVGV
jgi:hypothetical protein